ncbi:MAG: hypothetical protein JJ902_07745 [Roseibium sp.]|nr:hypothetical protein [Roseibium sp.]
MTRAGIRRVRAAALAALLSAFAQPAAAQTLSRDPGTFPALTCQQIWYLVHEIRAEGRICPANRRAATAFRSVPRCISDDERILSSGVRDYLAKLRDVGRTKGCPDL